VAAVVNRGRTAAEAFNDPGSAAGRKLARFIRRGAATFAETNPGGSGAIGMG